MVRRLRADGSHGRPRCQRRFSDPLDDRDRRLRPRRRGLRLRHHPHRRQRQRVHADLGRGRRVGRGLRAHACRGRAGRRQLRDADDDRGHGLHPRRHGLRLRRLRRWRAQLGHRRQQRVHADLGRGRHVVRGLRARGNHGRPRHQRRVRDGVQHRGRRLGCRRQRL